MIESALQDCRAMKHRMSSFQPLATVEEELEYLLAVMDGKDPDRSKLALIDIGLYAAREFEDRDDAFAEKLHRVEEVVKKMRGGATT